MDSSWLQHADPTAPARDLTVEAAQAIGILKTSGQSKGLSFNKLKALLDSRSDRDILDGLRRVIALKYQNKPCLPYFSSVVKNVANPNIEIKKLVYIYLLHYAESDPDLALLSVNAIQKSLTDTNPQVRALALRTMSGMRVPVISQIVSLAIKRGASDMSPQVRKAAALAIPKCYSLDPNSLPQLLDYLSTLLGDKQYFVAGPAVQAFLEVCPDRIELIHPHYRGLVRKLVDMDEWSQLATLQVLTRYVRRCFPLHVQKVTRTKKAGFYDDEPTETEDTGEFSRSLHPDHESLLKASSNLLYSRSAAVATAVTSVFLYVGTSEYLQTAIGPLISLLRSSPETQETTLRSIVSVALDHPSLFVPFASRFLISTTDAPSTWRLKIEVLTLIFPHAALHLQTLILNELEHFCHASSLEMVRESVQAIGRCAQTSPSASARCFRILLSQISSFDSVLVSEVLTVMRHLIQRDPTAHHKTIIRLARNLDRTTSPQARATIIWLVGEFAVLNTQNSHEENNAGIAPDVLRILCKGFSSESEEVKAQIVLLAAKCYLLWLQRQNLGEVSEAGEDAGKGMQDPIPNLGTDHPIAKLWEYTLLLARYDTSYDLRDRARLFKNLLADPRSTQLASLLLLAPKPVPHAPSPSESRKGLLVGTTTMVVGEDVAGLHGLPGYEALPEWVEAGQEPDASLREGADSSTVSDNKSLVTASSRLDDAVKEQGLEKVVASSRVRPQAKSSGNQAKTFDDWLEESEDEDETDESSEEEDDSGSEEEESEGDDESSEDEGVADQKKGLMR
jgi:AP-3 complex subunit beta